MYNCIEKNILLFITYFKNNFVLNLFQKFLIDMN